MALKKTITNNKGVSYSYHKIVDLNISSIHDGNVDIFATVYSYVDEEIRKQSEMLQVHSDEYRFEVPLADVETQSVFAIAYGKLKETDTFADAEDC